MYKCFLCKLSVIRYEDKIYLQKNRVVECYDYDGVVL